METSGCVPVLLVFLSPRVSDLTALKALDDARLPPTGNRRPMVLNLGRADVDMDASAQWSRHLVFRAAQNNGAATIYMPRLFGAGPEIERPEDQLYHRRRLDTVVPAVDAGQSALHCWLEQMEAAFEPIRSWLP